MSQVQNRLTDYIVTNFLFGDATRTPAAGDSLVQTGVIDSTGVLELIEFLEEQFGIQVAESETVPDNLDSLDALCGFVERKRAEQPAGA